MYFVKLYFLLTIAILLITSDVTISQSTKTNSVTFGYIRDTGIQYRVTAFFVDKAFKTQSAVQTFGYSLESILTNLNSLRKNGLGIIIDKVSIIRKNRKEEELKTLPPDFMRETDSLLKKHWTEQYRKNK